MCAHTSVGQLFKIPNLIEHYKEHKTEGNTTSISFIDYIKLHYSKNAENNQKHQQLPFKSIDNSATVLFVFTVLHFQIQPLKLLLSVERQFIYTKSFTSKLATSIWLPPKLV